MSKEFMFESADFQASNDRQVEIDVEWYMLFLEAKRLGISVRELRTFFGCDSVAGNTQSQTVAMDT